MILSDLVKSRIQPEKLDAACGFFGVSKQTVENWLNGKTQIPLKAAQLVLDEQEKEMNEGAGFKSMWDGRKVMILLPTYRTVNPKTHFSLFACYKDFGPEKVGLIPQEGTVIHESRNLLIHKAMQTDAETFIMCDDDMVLPCGNEWYFNGVFKAGVTRQQASYNAISRLMSHDKTKQVIGALYFGRHEFGQAQCHLGFQSEYANTEFRNGGYSGLIEQPWVATGLIKIERSAILALKEAIDGGKFPECKPMQEGKWYGYFSPIRVGVGEDVSFCMRMNEIGVKTYLDASLVCLHADGNTLYGPSNTRNPKK